MAALKPCWEHCGINESQTDSQGALKTGILERCSVTSSMIRCWQSCLGEFRVKWVLLLSMPVQSATCLSALWLHYAPFLKDDAFISIHNFGSIQCCQFSWVCASECILLMEVLAGTSPLNKYLICRIELDTQPLWTTENVMCPVLLVPSASR